MPHYVIASYLRHIFMVVLPACTIYSPAASGCRSASEPATWISARRRPARSNTLTGLSGDPGMRRVRP